MESLGSLEILETLFLFFSEADNFDPVYLSIHDAKESTMFTDFI